MIVDLDGCQLFVDFADDTNPVRVSLPWQAPGLEASLSVSIFRSPVATILLIWTMYVHSFHDFDSVCILSIITGSSSIFLQCLISFVQL